MKTGAFPDNLLARARTFFESGRHRPWVAAAVVCILLLGAWSRFSLPQIPITNKDTGGYISPALSLLKNGTYEPSYRNFPYAGFVWIILKSTGTFSAIAVVQHVLGLASGLLFWLSWQRLRVFFPPDWPVTAAHAALGLALVSGLVLSMHPMFFERSMRPEAIFPFLIGLHVFGAASFLESSLIRKSAARAIGWGAFMTAVSFCLFVLKPIWGLGVVAGGLPFLIVLAVSQGKWRLIPFVAGALGTLAGLALFVVPDEALSSMKPRRVSLISQQLFFVHANLVEREINRDLAASGPPPFSREILAAASEDLREGFESKPVKVYRTLGFNPDDFLDGQANARVVKFFRKQPGGADRFLRHYYIQAWLDQPFGMLKKIANEFFVFYRLDAHLTRGGSPMKLGTCYHEARGLFAMPDLLPYSELGQVKSYLESLDRMAVADEPVLRYSLITMFLNLLDNAYLIVLLAFLIAGALFGRKGAPATGGVPLLWLGLWIFSYNFGITLTVALVHSMSIQRYTDTQFCLTVFSFCAGLLLLFSLLSGAGGERKRVSADAPEKLSGGGNFSAG
jgi:hypothetical protein